MENEDIRRKLYDQLEEDYPSIFLVWMDIQDISSDVPCFLVTLLPIGKSKVYELVKLGDEEVFMSCEYGDYVTEKGRLV